MRETTQPQQPPTQTVAGIDFDDFSACVLTVLGSFAIYLMLVARVSM